LPCRVVVGEKKLGQAAQLPAPSQILEFDQDIEYFDHSRKKNCEGAAKKREVNGRAGRTGAGFALLGRG